MFHTVCSIVEKFIKIYTQHCSCVLYTCSLGKKKKKIVEGDRYYLDIFNIDCGVMGIYISQNLSDYTLKYVHFIGY